MYDYIITWNTLENMAKTEAREQRSALLKTGLIKVVTIKTSCGCKAVYTLVTK